MKFSEHWLRTMVNPPLDSAALCDKLTMAGLEVEDAAPAAPPFSGVVVARIDAVAAHPGADRLRVCTVDAGTGAALQIVCGAPNAAAGMKVPCALVGAALPGGLAIREAAVRGVVSHGMLCSARELGIDDDASGLLRLPDDAVVGADLRAQLRLDDTLITLKLTPNRADCLSLLGLAREVAAITGASLVAPPANAVAVTGSARRGVRIEDADGCPRFTSRTIEGIDPSAPTPDWMKERLLRSGIRSISAVVDITNYVMLELGQPLHAYDDRLLDGDIVVRFAAENEELVLLNGQVLKLERDLLLVCDEMKPLGLAGIMGGEHSGIGAATTTVFLEAAFWNPAVIQGKSRRLGFVSDAGHRFERGVDFAGCVRALERATELILASCGGRAGPVDDVCARLPERAPVRVRPRRVASLLGVDLPRAAIASLFDRLQLRHEPTGDDLMVTPPSYRFDLAIEEDFVEEVARLHGYDAIPAVPAVHVQDMLPAPERLRTASALKRVLVARDWQETITFSFVGSAVEAALFPARPDAAAPLRVLNPIASHLDVMRTTLAGGLIEVLRTNLARRAERVRVFEVGRCFLRTAPGHDQPLRIGGLAYGDVHAEQWGQPARNVDFFDVKADLEALVAPLTLRTAAGEHPALHPGRAATVSVAKQAIGWIGELHPRLVKQFELPHAPVLFELDLEPLTAIPLPTAQPVSRLPVVRRDLAVVVDEGIAAQAVVDALAAARVASVEAVRLFDVYRGTGLSPGMKSLAILVLMQDTERTLTDPEIDAAMAQLLRIVVEQFGGSLRQ
ncbi:MAG: phenylalanine--tRNA ligase subunit beta [Betaproteobacteria bacterium]|nr:phenylalanine--tRNA ligase subunit beta [Betaproteobacteria bacterium]